MTGVKHKRNTQTLELLSMLEHGVSPIRRNDAQLDVGVRLYLVEVRRGHGARVKGRDLVVIAVSHDHGLGGVGVPDLAHELGGNFQVLQALQIVLAVIA